MWWRVVFCLHCGICLVNDEEGGGEVRAADVMMWRCVDGCMCLAEGCHSWWLEMRLGW